MGKYALIFCALLAGGCGGTKMLKEPQPQPAAPVLAAGATDSLAAQLLWVIVRDGPGSWASPADWDEYQLSFTNSSGQDLVVTRIDLVGALDEVVPPQTGRAELVKATRRAAKRYGDQDIEVHAGLTGTGMFGTGVGMMVAGTYVALHAAYGALAGTAAASAVGPAAVAAVYAAPVIIVGSVVRGAGNARLNREIKERQSVLPLVVAADDTVNAHLFFPITPAPKRLEITYLEDGAAAELVIDTTAALAGLHLVPAPTAQDEETQPN